MLEGVLPSSGLPLILISFCGGAFVGLDAFCVDSEKKGPLHSNTTVVKLPHEGT